MLNNADNENSSLELLDDPNFRNNDNFNEKQYNKRQRKERLNLPFTTKDESKMLKYALKLSEMEYKAQQTKKENSLNIPKTYADLPLTPTYEADDIDFLEFSKYIEKLWQGQGKDTGVFKIIPPSNWVENYKKSYHCCITDTLKKDLNKKYVYRRQNLSGFQSAEKFDHVKDIFFDNFLQYGRLFELSLIKQITNEKEAHDQAPIVTGKQTKTKKGKT